MAKPDSWCSSCWPADDDYDREDVDNLITLEDEPNEEDEDAE